MLIKTTGWRTRKINKLKQSECIIAGADIFAGTENESEPMTWWLQVNNTSLKIIELKYGLIKVCITHMIRKVLQ